MNEAYRAAVRFLARREHGFWELSEKLLKKHDASDVQEALEACQAQGLQSDARFAKSVCRSRVNQGYGPVRIRQILQTLRVSDACIEKALADDYDWLTLALHVLHKKQKMFSKTDTLQIQKLKQFLFYRGFTSEMITLAMDSVVGVKK